MPFIPTWVLPQAISNQHETNPFQSVWINSGSVEILPWVLLPRFVEASFLTMPPPSGSAGNCTPRHPTPARWEALLKAWSPCAATAIKSGFILDFHLLALLKEGLVFSKVVSDSVHNFLLQLSCLFL